MNEWGGLPRHPVEALRNEIDRLTILRDLTLEPPLLALIGLMDELLAEDWQPFNVAWAYHEFASAIVHADAPRVLGDPWRDYLLWAILEREHLFSRKMAANRKAQVLTGMMAGDLHIMQQLFLLDDGMVRDWCRELMRAEVSDSWANWSMSMPTPNYGDGPLAQMRCHLVLSEDWGQLAEKLADYHAQYGSGVFLSSPWLVWNGAELAPEERSAAACTPVPEALRVLMTGEPVNLWMVVRDRAEARAIRHATLPEGRVLIRVTDAGDDAARLYDRLRGQPARFIICLPFDEGYGSSYEDLPDNAVLLRLAGTPPQGDAARCWRVVQSIGNPAVYGGCARTDRTPSNREEGPHEDL